MLQDCIAQSDNLAWFAWNMDTGKDHTVVLDAYDSGLKGIVAVIAIPVFVFIKGYFQAGKTIDTSNICAVIDLSNKTIDASNICRIAGSGPHG